MAAPPTPVTSPGGPDTPEGPIILSANCAVVTSTFVCLDWQPAAAAPGGGAQVQLPTFAAIKAFVPFCRLSRNPADLAAAGAVNLLCVRLTDAAWSRLFTEMEAAQVFTQNFPTIDDLYKATRDAVYPNMRATIAGETELREELEDGIEYKLSAEGKLRIEEKRIYFLARG